MEKKESTKPGKLEEKRKEVNIPDVRGIPLTSDSASASSTGAAFSLLVTLFPVSLGL